MQGGLSHGDRDQDRGRATVGQARALGLTASATNLFLTATTSLYAVYLNANGIQRP